MTGELVLNPAEVNVAPVVDGILCPTVGRGVPGGLVNLGPCPEAVTMAGELVLTPTVPDVDSILCPVDGIVLPGMPEELPNLGP